MTNFPNSPRLVNGGIVLIDPASGAVQRIIALQYNPETLSRSLEVRSVAGEGGDRSEALRLTGPPIETVRLEAEIDATDKLEEGDDAAVQQGLHAQLAALETILYPTSDALQRNNDRAGAGTLEIAPMEAPLTLFVWGRNRVLPVRITELSVTEEAFDPSLNPIRARVSLGLRVLSVDDLGFSHKGGGLFMSYLRLKERLAGEQPGGVLGQLGVEAIG